MSADNQIVTQDVAKDPAQTAILNKYTAISAPIANRRIGAATAPLTTDQNAAGERSSATSSPTPSSRPRRRADFGNAVVAFMNQGGIRTNIDAVITVAPPFSAVQPFGNSLVTLTLTGAQIDRALEQQLDGLGTSRRCCRCPGASRTPGAPRPARLASRPRHDQDQRHPVDPAASYRVTVNSFLADGGDGFTELKNGTDRLGGAVDLDALAAYLSLPANDPIAPTPRDRITVVP